MKSKYVYWRAPVDSISYSKEYTNFSGGKEDFAATKTWFFKETGFLIRSPFPCVDWMPAENEQSPDSIE
ncbi:MAG: hypothetical protein N3E45_02820 [Oscillatoriaceae bacterium SKW80]|nr:hypothetical protein [Oscillatoriaceae bacterium SKYG93]MCX8119754.1 hypothetical protein [Oscillatoriaceae bacterium SKW80]MDW8452369.1 hypothetical protein [Oscillatoriaceae cyanobacterium SKYGB_i_bin93]HIK27658.1 hypothetical protein [Oscillatoriaceae cyanobacterium M7585_C2015_266]